MKIKSRYLLDDNNSRQCGFVGYALEKAYPYSFINEDLPAYAYIEYLVPGEGTTKAYVDKDLYEYLLDCAIPAKVQYAREFAILKAEAPKPRNSKLEKLEIENRELKAKIETLQAEIERKARPEKRKAPAVENDIEYREKDLSLIVTMAGKTYKYPQVTKTLYMSLMRSENKKAFIEKNIKPYCTAEQLA